MLKYYEINGKTCFTDHMDFQCPPEADWKEIPEPRTAEELSWLFFREPGSCRASFLVNHEGLLWEKEESVDWLNSRKLEENKALYGKQGGCTEGKCAAALPKWIRERIGPCRQCLPSPLPGAAVRGGIPGRTGEKAGPYPGHRGCGEHAPYGPPSLGRRRDLPDRDLRYLRPGDGPVGV